MIKKIVAGVSIGAAVLGLSACGSPTKSVTLRDSSQVVIKLPDQVRVFCDRGNLIYAKDQGGLFGIPNSDHCNGEVLVGTIK